LVYCAEHFWLKVFFVGFEHLDIILNFLLFEKGLLIPFCSGVINIWRGLNDSQFVDQMLSR